MLADVFLTLGCRTPIGTLGGGLSDVSAAALGSTVIRETLNRAGIKSESVDEIIMGNVLTAGGGQNPARQAAIGAGLPLGVGATTIGKVCGSGLKAIMLAAQAIQCRDARLIVAGGMESMSRAPYLLQNARKGYRLGNGELIDSMLHDGLLDAFDNREHMGCFADQMAVEYRLTRQDQDDYAIASYQRARHAAAAGLFDDEIVAIETVSGKTAVKVSTDEQPKKFDEAKMRLLRPAFSPSGTVTAANASGINDGAAAVAVFGESARQALGLRPQFKILGYASAAQEPSRFTLAPIGALTRLLDRLALGVGDIDLFEINEAFALVAMCAMRELSIPHEKLNVSGGSIALGHPLGASGARILVTLLHAMVRSKTHIGVASLCIGGGEAVAMAVEQV